MNILALQIESLTDARYFAAMNCSFIGFKISEEAPLKYAEISAIVEWIEGPQLLLEFPTNDLALFEKYTALKPHAIIVNKDFAPHLDVRDDIRVGAHVSYDDFDDYKTEKHLDFLVLHLEEENINNLTELNEKLQSTQKPLFIDFEVPFSKYKGIIDQIRCKSMIVKGSAEEKVGIKSFDEIDEIFEYFETI